ncbi:YraN family protein [Rhodovulum sp. YNF3179]|uniref:YraN family protein n=1 Tax=Rhodovulum sp. YNF3179 TaxID=3425127 RepID=UPI003D35041F
MSGIEGYESGRAAEEAVARHYARRGHAVLARRWRGAGGEIDLVCARAGLIVFVEVKKARSLDAAALRLSPGQIARLQTAALEYLGTCPKGADSDMRFDLACVDGVGRIVVTENAIWG